MKKKILLTCVLLILAAGCNQIEKIQEALTETQEVSVKVDKEIALLTEGISILRTEIAENQTLTELQKAEVEKNLTVFTVKLDKVLAFKLIVNDQLAYWQEQLVKADESGLAGKLEAGGNVISRIANVLPPPFNGYGSLIGMVLLSIGGAWVKREKAKTNREKTEHAETKTVLKDVVKSVDVFLEDVGLDATIAPIARKILGGAQDTATSEAVRKIKSGG